MTASDRANQSSVSRPLLWALYLACSWTWCIGMFLPALLLRDLGIWSFLAFAIPNIVGAAALGWVMSTPGASRGLLHEHRAMVWWFSSLTVAFQVYFAAWVGSLMGSPWSVILPGMLVLAAVLPGRRNAAWHAVSVLIWVSSAAGIVWLLATRGMPVLAPRGELPPSELWPLAAVCGLGFLLCPYLDATFHRARIEADHRSPLAFGMGFGWFFAIMILGTVVASPLLLMIARGQRIDPQSALVPFLLLCTVGQLLYTVRVHAIEWPSGRLGLGRMVFGLPALLVMLGVLAASRPEIGLLTRSYSGLTLGEVGYRCFMSLYGLSFPAYVLCCMVPVTGADGLRVSRPTSGRVTFWLAGVVCAVPLYWLGFVERQTWWVLPGIAIVLLAGLGAAASVRRSRA